MIGTARVAKARFALVSIALVLACPARPTAAAEPAGRQVVDFVFDVTHGDQQLREGMDQAMAEADPEMATFMRNALQSADPKRLRQQITAAVADQLSAEDVQAFRDFIRSPAGRSLQQAATAAPDTAQLVAAVQQLPDAEQQVIETFLSGSAFHRAVQAMSSPQVAEVAQRWGQQVGCDYARAHPDQYDVDAVMAAGACPAPAGPGASPAPP